MTKNDAARGLREAREYANKLLAGEGSHQQYSDLVNTLLVGMYEEPEFDPLERPEVLRQAFGR